MKFSSKRKNVLKINSRGTSKFLGDLEALVMEAVWGLDEATVRSVKQHLEKQGKHLAYTTILTEMQNLEKKGLLKSRRVRRRNVYVPRVSREEFLDHMVGSAMKSLLEDFPEQVVSHLLPKERIDPQELESLIRLLGGRESR